MASGIYVASKTHHAPTWRALRAAGYPIISTWIDEAGPGESASLSELWVRCIAETKQAELLLWYAEPGEILKGAYAEAGIALSQGTPVRYVGPSDLCSMSQHPGVEHMPSIEAALADYLPHATPSTGTAQPPSPQVPADAQLWIDRLLAWHAEHQSTDPAHDVGHFVRVWNSVVAMAAEEGEANLVVLAAATMLHDLVNVPKNHPDRALASQQSAAAATTLLRSMGFMPIWLDAVAHAISAHSFSAQITPTTLEARLLQDADRLDAIGAIGVARCFSVSGSIGRALFDQKDPLALHRSVDDQKYALDHFQTKLFGLGDGMQTDAGRRRAVGRTMELRRIQQRLALEISGQA